MTSTNRHAVDRDSGLPQERWHAQKAAAMANHASMRTTQLYDRRRDEVSLDEVDRIAI
jgi:hypothetical protein